jgi:hypothetical protein
MAACQGPASREAPTPCVCPGKWPLARARRARGAPQGLRRFSSQSQGRTESHGREYTAEAMPKAMPKAMSKAMAVAKALGMRG